MYPFGVTVTRLRGTQVLDPYSGQETDTDWESPDQLEFLGCAMWTEQSMEPVTAGSELRTQVVTITKVALPYGADIVASDRFQVGDLVYEVTGDPWHVKHPMTGWTPGCVVSGTRTDG